LDDQKGLGQSGYDWYRKAAEGGYPTAMTNLGCSRKRPVTSRVAVSWWAKAAALGDEVAMYNLGLRCYDDQNLAEARRWFTACVDARGDAEAMDYLASVEYLDGDERAARRWLAKAAASGSPNAMYKMGLLAEDAGIARDWYLEAAMAGDADAMHILSRLAGEDGDEDAALVWAQRAEDAGDAATDD
jgi:TPR repeat protein